MKQFSQKTLEQLGIYIYCLIDPRDKKIFYIGKGTGNRVFHHALGVLGNYFYSEKIDKIREILKSGLDVQYYIIRYGLQDDNIAFEVEASLIDTLDFCGNILSNIVSGHHSWDRGLKSILDIESTYSADEIILENIEDTLLIININKNYQRKHSSREATEGDWKLNPVRANKAKYIIAEYHGIWREIYIQNIGWQSSSEENNSRYRTSLIEVVDEDIFNKYTNKFLFKKRGSQNPIRYINC